LPAAIVNGGEDSCWKWKDFQISRARDLDLGSGDTAYRRASLIDLYGWLEFAGLENDGLENDGIEQEQTYILRTKKNFNVYNM